ncbi:MAG: hypothetical protein ACREU3_04135 [Steroidobacteraceae bacterium]
MIAWKQALERQLSEPGAPAAITLGALSRAASIARETDVPDRTLHAWITDATARGRLAPVVRGLYLNRFTSPPGRLADAVPHVRRDAVVSLHTALDEAGAYNNPPHGATAVVPLDAGPTRPRVGKVTTAEGPIYVRAIPRRILEAGALEDRLDLDRGRAHPRATPEKALLDWLYLARSPRSTLSPPSLQDVEIDELNNARLRRLAKAMGLEQTLTQWREGKFVLRARP